ncbi:hypothetical protein [Streptomyces sp. G7(2002)]|uniref:hypothetical protein n=1 Tax=Streptomyces sp. G7(2002) TaxID=2971798 RepID=UPI00237D578C|nr:hypothetical protein [Streptomyces sp. G7(2002)]WDT55766.1 hypothetical protein NUT86_17800 [Streptomyces sp. G7(2002)]
MSFDPNEIVTIELDCAGWNEPYTRDISRHQLGQVLLTLDDMAADTDDRAPDEAQTWPTPEAAYVSAPSILDELEWINHTAAETSWDEELDRQYFLRKAAVFDRIALRNAVDEDPIDTTGNEDVAEVAAVMLLDYDKTGREIYGGTPYPPGQPAAEADPRGYVRQEYALWSVCTCHDSSQHPCLKHPSA